MLDLTDNIQGDAIVPPRDVVRRDPDDSDPVVAADKGTATFSEIASCVTIEYGFWLGGAFASGGSGGPSRAILQKFPRNPQTDRQPGRGPLRFKGPEVSQEVINLSPVQAELRHARVAGDDSLCEGLGQVLDRVALVQLTKGRGHREQG